MKFTHTEYKALDACLQALENKKESDYPTSNGDETVRLCVEYGIKFSVTETHVEITYSNAEGALLQFSEPTEVHWGAKQLTVRVAVVRAAIKLLQQRQGLKSQ